MARKRDLTKPKTKIIRLPISKFVDTKYRDYALNRDLTLGASLAEWDEELGKLDEGSGNYFSKFSFIYSQ